MRYKSYAATYAGEQLKVNKENYFVNGICREDLDQLVQFQVNKNFGRRNFYAVTSGVKCDEAGDELSQVAVDVLKGFYGSDFAEESSSYFGMANSAIVGRVFEKKDQHFEVDISLLYIENDIATVHNFGDMPVYYYENNKLKKISGKPPQNVRIEKGIYDNRGIAQLQTVKKDNIPYIGFSDDECESVPYVSESIKLKNKALFVLCSKSVIDVVGEQEVEEILADTKIKGGNKMARIIDCAVKKKPDENYTVLVVNVDKGIPITDEDAKSTGAWAVVALLCAVLYFASPYILSGVYTIAANTKAFIETHFSNDEEYVEDIKWTPREEVEDNQQNGTVEENTEDVEQSDESETVTSEPVKAQTNTNSKPQNQPSKPQSPVDNIVEEQTPETPTEPQQQVEFPGITTPPETSGDTETPIDFD